MPHKLFRYMLLSLSILSFHCTLAQNDPAACHNLKSGTFYSYPPNVNDNWKSERNGDMQAEINLTTGDTLYFQVAWSGNCQYSLTYKSGGKKTQTGRAGPV